MDNEVKKACSALLSQLPECSGSTEKLADACVYFGISAEQIITSACRLGTNYDLQYQGIRLLIGACIEEFLKMYSTESAEICEVTVPSPVCVIMALQNSARGKITFTTQALFAQIVLRGLLLDIRPLDMASCGKRRCGLNKMRIRLIEAPPVRRPDYLLQFGVLCDECVKCGESLSGKIRTISATFPKCGTRGPDPAYTSNAVRRQLSDFCDVSGVELRKMDVTEAVRRFTRLQQALESLGEMNGRPDRMPLKGNSLALVQSAQLMIFDDWEPVIAALECLESEMAAAPPDDGMTRLYTFYVPFLQPEIDERFRSNGVRLLGNVAFLHDAKFYGFDLADSAAGWFCGMNIVSGAETECGRVAAEMRRSNCGAYLTGMFGFDRWMGAAAPLQRRILRDEYGIQTYFIDADFWCENGMPFGVLDRVDNICALLRRYPNKPS